MSEENIKNETAEHYDDFDTLYENWSGAAFGGYHFGIVNNITDLFHNDIMVKNLSNLIIDCFEKKDTDKIAVLDAGCGVGDVSQEIHKRFNKAQIEGLTISKKQFEKAQGKYNTNKQINIVCGDFEHTTFTDNKFDIVFFVDSICHGIGSNKSNALTEAYRILKPGGRLIVCDVFLQKQESMWGKWFKFINNKVKEVWCVDTWGIEDDILTQADIIGYINYRKIILTWKIVPSVLHIIFTKIPWALLQFFKDAKYKKELKYFCKLGLFAPLLGMHPIFRYQISIWDKKR